jgi:hypothetical protein
LIARGSEGDGRIGELTTYVLLQMVLADTVITVPFDAPQLALMRESMIIPKDIAAAVSVMDGSETMTVGGHRVYQDGRWSRD